MQWNKAQQEAICFHNGPCLTLAGPGSGKTAVITQRTYHLIHQWKVDPFHILVVTFTRAAAREMRERFLRLEGQESTRVTFGTFHAVFFTILKHAYGYSADNILREDEKLALMKQLIRRFHVDYEDEAECISLLLAEISSVKNSHIDIAHYYSANVGEQVFRDIYRAYQKELSRSRRIDFDDMLVYTYELFAQRKDILSQWQEKYQYILVDEFQDINSIQYEIVKMLAAPRNNLFIVGDDDQSIYRFRQARPEIMLNFVRDYPKASQILLDVNYRCDANIVAAAGRVIAHNQNRFPKDIRAERGAQAAVVRKVYKDQREENLGLLQALQAYFASGGQPGDVAVLFRTNTQPRLLMQQLMEYNIPFQTRDRLPNIYDHWIMKDLEAYIRIAGGSNARSDFLQIMNRPNRYIGRDSLEEETVAFDVWADYYNKMEQEWIARRIDKLNYDCNMLARMNPFSAVNYIRRGIGYEEYLTEYAKKRNINPEDLLDVLEQLTELSKGFESFRDWERHRTEYREELRAAAEAQRQKKEGVVLSTLHSSKGLEFDIVFLIDVNEGVMPYKKALLQAELEEERRMFYVGMTRAKKQLYLFSVEQIGNHGVEPSRFLKEMEDQPFISSKYASSSHSSKRSAAASCSSSETMFSRDGLPSSSSK